MALISNDVDFDTDTCYKYTVYKFSFDTRMIDNILHGTKFIHNMTDNFKTFDVVCHKIRFSFGGNYNKCWFNKCVYTIHCMMPFTTSCKGKDIINVSIHLQWDWLIDWKWYYGLSYFIVICRQKRTNGNIQIVYSTYIPSCI